MHTGAAKRLIASPRSDAADHHSTAQPLPSSAVLSTLELRRLVAAMVD